MNREKNMNNSSSHNKTAWLLSGLLVLLAILCILWLSIARRTTKHYIARVYQDGVLLQSIDLSLVDTPYEFTVTGNNGESNTLRITSDSVGIISANCPNRICVKQGYIHSSLFPITCLPNRLVVQLIPKDASGPDAVTY